MAPDETRLRWARSVLIAIALLPICACTDEPPEPAVQTVDDGELSAYLAGGESCYPQVVSDFREWSPLDPEAQWFGRVGMVRMLSEDRWVVTDPGRTVLHVLLSDGEGQSIGGPGEAPGEFRHLTRLWLPAADTIAVFDRAHGRVSYFSPNGALLDDERVSAAPAAGFFGSFPGGGRIERRVITEHSGGAEGGFWRDSIRFFQWDEDGEAAPLTAALPDADRYQVPFEFGFGVLFAPWGLRPTYTLSRSGVLVIASGEQPAVRFYGAEAGEVVLPLPDLSREITSGDAAADRRERLAGSGDGSGRARMYDDFTVPDRTPQYAHAPLDDDGWLWVARYPKPGEPPRYMVFGSDGEMRQEVELPPRSRLGGAAGGTVVAVGTDSLDVHVLYTASRECR